jgi:hypothetical protein
MEQITKDRLMSAIRTRDAIINRRVEQLHRIKVSDKEGEDEFEDVLLVAEPPMSEWATPGTTVKFMMCAPSLFHEFNTIMVDVDDDGFSLDSKPIEFEGSEKVHELVSAKIREIADFS